MRYWGTEDNVTRSGKTGKPSRRPARTDRSGGTRAGSARGTSRGRGAARPTRPTVASGGSVSQYPFLRQFYRHPSQLSDRLLRALFALLVAALIYVFVLGDGGAIRIVQLRMKRSHLEANIAELERDTAYLEQTIERLKDDYTYIEKIGRERYGYIKPGDRVYKIVPQDDHNS
jgi:cell division protein FtsB